MIYIAERFTNLETLYYEQPVDEAVLRVLKSMVQFRMGKEKAEKAISEVMQTSMYSEKAAPFMAVIYAYLSYNDELIVSGETSEEKRREEAEVLLGKVLQQSREQSGLTVQDIAQQAGLKGSEVMALEEGSFNFPSLTAVLGIESIRKILPDKLGNLFKEKETM